MYDNVRMSKIGRQKIILSTTFLKYFSYPKQSDTNILFSRKYILWKKVNMLHL